MKNNQRWHWALTVGSSVALCSALAAQSPTSSTPQGAGQRGMATTQQGPVSATGCLQRAERAAATGESSAAPSSAGADTTGGFVLKNARVGGASSAGSERPQATNSGADTQVGAVAGSRGRELRLMADSAVNLSEHVGHQVTVTGSFGGAMSHSAAPGSAPGSSSPSSSASGAGNAGPGATAGAAGTSSAGAGASGSMAAGGERGPFKVSTISMISATCSGS